jgi:hypothetical protein
LDFERKFAFFFKTHKNSYMRPFGTIDPKYGGHRQEIWSFG